MYAGKFGNECNTGKTYTFLVNTDSYLLMEFSKQIYEIPVLIVLSVWPYKVSSYLCIRHYKLVVANSWLQFS